MDRWPGAYPASEPPTPAPETPQHQQHQPKYPVHQQLLGRDSMPQGAIVPSTKQQDESQSQSWTAQIAQTAQHMLGRESKPEHTGNSSTVQPSRLPDQDRLSREELQHQDFGAHSLKDSGAKPSDAEHRGFRGTTLQDERPPTIKEAVGGRTYTRENEECSFPTQLEEQPKRNAQPGQSAQAGWPLSDVSVQHEEQPRKAYQYQPDSGHREVREVQQQPHVTANLSHGHPPSDVPVAYQQQSREVPKQPHVLPQQSRAVQQQSQEAGSGHHDHPQQHSGAASFSHDHQPIDAPIAYQQQARETQQQPHGLRHESRELSQQPHRAEQRSFEAEQQSTRGSHPTTSSDENSSTPPYWGSLPTAPTGGIYNTVTGHGSARDDHDQHHNHPNKDRATEHTAADATIPSAATSFPTGGVYNSVTGHGSNDEGTKHHDTVGSDDHDTAASRVPLLGAGQSKNVQHATGSSAPLLGADSAVNEDRTTYRSSRTEPFHSQDATANTADRSTYGEAGTQRAFPLATSDRDGCHEDKSHQRAEQGLAAAALAGTGVAAYEFSGKNDKQYGRDTRDVAASHEHAATGTEQRGTQAQHISHHTPPQERRSSMDSKDKHKDHHGLFGFSGKHGNEEKRDSRDIAPIPGTHPSSAEPRTVQAQPISPPNAEAKRSSHDEKSLSKENSPKRKGSVLGGIFHRHKEDKKEEGPQHQHRRSDSVERRKLHKEPPPTVAQAMRQSTPPKKDSLDEDRTRQAGPVGGIFHGHGNTHKETHTSESKNASPSTGVYTSAANDRASAIPSTRPTEKYDETSKHGHKGAMATGAGVAAGGLAVSELAHRHGDNRDVPGQVETTTSGTDANESGPYKILPSGTPSGIASGATGASHQSSSLQNTSHAAQGGYGREGDSHNSRPYNALGPGTASGIATSEADRASTAHNTTASTPHDTIGSSNQDGHSVDRGGPSDRLGSGTSSGIATGVGAAAVMAASRGTESSERYDNAHGTTDRTGSSHAFESTIQSGSAASGDDWRSSLPPTVTTTRVEDMSAQRALQGKKSTSHSAGNSTPNSQPAETHVTAGTTHDKQSPSHAGSATWPYNALESGTTSGVAAAGEASSQSATQAASHDTVDTAIPRTQSRRQDAGHANDLPKPYNVLPSGTPSGVNIEYRRRSKEIEHLH